MGAGFGKGCISPADAEIYSAIERLPNTTGLTSSAFLTFSACFTGNSFSSFIGTR